jgi:predicted Mrr-cat superfamily restriction endonuclease
VNVWRLIAHHAKPEWAIHWSRQNERIAVGWGRIGDIQQQGYRSAADIGAAIRREYPEERNSGLGGPSLWGFYAEMEIGDLVILSSKKRREAVLEVKGEYEWRPTDPPYHYPYRHQRRARLRNLDPEELWRTAGARPAPGQSIRWTLIRCAEAVNGPD